MEIPKRPSRSHLFDIRHAGRILTVEIGGRWGTSYPQMYWGYIDGIPVADAPEKGELLRTLIDMSRRWPVDWELRASETPYDGMVELTAEYQPGPLSDVNTIDIVAFNLAAVDANASFVTAQKAKIAIWRAQFSTEEKISVGYRVFEKDKVVKRGHIGGNVLQWTTHPLGHIGHFEIDVPEGAIVHAFANYAGVGQHHYYVGDPTRFQNLRRAIYEAFDPQFALMKEVLAKASRLHAPSRDFEACMSCLFWMLGFATAHVGTVITEAPDIIVARYPVKF